MGEPLNLLDKYMKKFFHSLYLQETCIAWIFAYCVMELTVVPSLVFLSNEVPLIWMSCNLYNVSAKIQSFTNHVLH